MDNAGFFTVYPFYADPGHGWLAVPIEHLERLGIADKITAYSYQHNGTAYLEEVRHRSA